jgi:transposase
VDNKIRSTFVCTDPIDICHALIRLKDVRVLQLSRFGPVLEVMVEQVVTSVTCPDCDLVAQVKDRPVVIYTDLPVFGTPCRLAWRKYRMRCVNSICPRKSWTLEDHRIAAVNCLLTTRCAKWATEQVGRHGRTVAGVARELDCHWDTVNDAVVLYGDALLDADRKRLTKTAALGLDETLFTKTGEYREKQWCTSVVDVGNHQLIDILPSRNYVDVATWVRNRHHNWKRNINYGSLDMSATYAAVFTVTLPDAQQVVDPFHCLQLANRNLDMIRRRVQNERLGHRGRKNDPLYKARKLLIMRSERLDANTTERLASLLELGDPDGEVAIAYRVKEALKDFYETTNIDDATEMLRRIQHHCRRRSMPKELQSFGNTIKRWFDKILAWHQARISNGPTEAMNNLIKRIKRVGFGFTNFRNYRIRALLYAGKPNWRVLDSIVVR